MLLGVSLALAQPKGGISKKQLVGTWTLASGEMTMKDGKKRPLVDGRDQKGQLMLDGKRFSLQVIAAYPKLAGDRLQTTTEEDKAVARAVLSYFGTYSVSEADGGLTFHIERSSYSNQNGGDFKRVITALTADEMTFTNPGRMAGGSNIFVWKRAK
jgi:hypothetical protein